MRSRFWTLVTLIVLLTTFAAGCAGSKDRSGSSVVPVKTLRPTFTPTPPRPTVLPASPTSLPTETPQATPIPPPPTEAPPPTAQPASFTVANATVNVRGGPGTSYARIGQVRQGQTFAIMGKNPTGDWWQFQFEGGAGWISASMVSAVGAESVQVAADIPTPPPTARPQPTTRPQPTKTPAPVTLFVQAGTEVRNADQANFGVVTFWGQLGKTSGAAIAGYQLKVSAPSGESAVAFADVWQYAYPGQGSKTQFAYNAKLELPRAAGAYRAVVVDGSGKEVSDAVSGTLLDRTHDVIINWLTR